MASSHSSSSITRPEYVQDMINQIYSEVMNIDPAQWVNQGYAGFNEWQQDALNKMASSNYMDNLANAMTKNISGGLGYMQQAWQGLQDMYQQGPLTASDITQEASNFYDDQAVQNAQVAANNQIYQQGGSALAQSAQQNMSGGAYTSGAVQAQNQGMSNILSGIGSADSQIANQAYNTALKEATGVLTGQRKMQRGALSALGKAGQAMVGIGNQAGSAINRGIQTQLRAGIMQQKEAQKEADANYFNEMGAQNLPWMYVNEMLKAAGVLNSASGTNRSTTVKTHSSGGLF